MANTALLKASGGANYRTFDTTATTTDALPMGNAEAASISSLILQVVGNTFTGSIKPRALLTGSGLTTANLEPIAYQNLGDGSDVTDDTAISDDGLFAIRADGVDLYLDVTVSAGSVTVYVNRLAG